TQPSLLYKHYQLSPQMIERLAITNLTSLLKAVFEQYVRNFDPSALDLILLQIYKLFDLCFVIVNTRKRIFLSLLYFNINCRLCFLLQTTKNSTTWCSA